MNDFSYEMGGHKTSVVMAIVFAMMCLIVLLAIIVILIQELSSKAKIFHICFDIIRNKPAINLSESRDRRLTLISHLMIEHILGKTYWTTLTMFFSIFAVLELIYSPGSSKLSILAILWLIPSLFLLKLCLFCMYVGCRL